jgi:hypothetical protein
MEFFYTLLQCKSHLSMFHSSPTSKIWYTSTEHDVHLHGAKPQNCVVQIFCTKRGQTLLFLSGTRVINFSFRLKHYNLTIYAVSFAQLFAYVLLVA